MIMKTEHPTTNNQQPTTNANDIPGWYDWHPWAAQTIAHLPEGAVYVEVGCFLGRSTVALAKLIAATGRKIALHAVDLFELPATAEPGMLELIPGGSRVLLPHFKANLKAHGVTKLVKVVQKPSTVAALDYAEASLDVVFLDADHSYAALRADIAAWWPKLKPGGVMAGHDIHTYASVWQAVHDQFKMQNSKLKIEVLGDQNIWVVRKPEVVP